MASLSNFRKQYPQYDGMSDAALAVALHRKFYTSIPMVDYLKSLGLDRGDVLYQLRALDSTDGNYLREQLAKPGKAEAEADAAKRQGGSLPDRRPGPVEGAARALAQGGTFGFGDELVGAGAAALDQNPTKTFPEKFDAYRSREEGLLNNFRVDNPVLATTAEIAGAIPTSMVAGGQLAARGATMGERALSGLAVGAGQGAVYGAGSGEGDVQDRMVNAGIGAATGGAVGGLAPVVGQAARRIVTPLPASAEQRAAAQVMKNEGVTLTAGQRTGSPKLRYAEAELGGSAAERLQDQQAEQFTRAALRRAGVVADRATPEVLDGAFTDLGQRFDRLASRTRVPFDQQLQDHMLQIATDYNDVSGAPARAVEAVMNRAAELAAGNRGVLAGEAYQNLRSKIGQLTKSADGPTKGALMDIQSALDDAVQRHMPAHISDAWRTARRNYRNLLVIEKAATGAGEAAASGIITPAKLHSAAVQQGRRAFARGQNDFTELANAGVQTMTPLPNSGTAQRLSARALAAIPAAIGGFAGSPLGAPGMVGGAVAGAALPWAAGRAIVSAPGRAILSNQLLNRPGAGVVENVVRSAAGPAAGTVAPPLDEVLRLSRGGR